MRYSTRYRSTSYSSGSFPPGVKWLIIANVVMFLIAYFAGGTSLGRDLRLLELVPDTVVHNFTIWQLFTYLFLHGGVWHLLVNMFTLWMFGRTLEAEWGTRQFLKYYFLCGVGAGICDVTLMPRLAADTAPATPSPASATSTPTPAPARRCPARCHAPNSAPRLTRCRVASSTDAAPVP